MKKLNSIIHPVVERDYQKWVSQNYFYPYTIKEAALLVETGSYKRLDFLISVSAPMKLRIQWIKKRDNISTDQIKKRMETQLPQEKKNEVSDKVIYNNNDILLIPQVLDLHNFLISKD